MNGRPSATLRPFLLALALLATFSIVAGTLPLFDPAAVPVHRIRLQLSQAAGRSLAEHPREYVRASIRIDDGSPLVVGIHLKGSTGSFQALEARPSLTVDFDRFIAGQTVGGISKVHLNNSAEDPSRLCEQLGRELFGRVGIPSPQITHGQVSLNGRNLGLYVVKEGFTPSFLERELGPQGGTLFEPERGADVAGPLRVAARFPPGAAAIDLDSLVRTCMQPDLTARWERLAEHLDTGRFLTFMAAEVILAHRDGYSLARNNYRVTFESGSGRVWFLPHGMDQLFAAPELPGKPQMAGAVARAVMETPEGNRQYEARFRALLPQLLDVPVLTNRVRELAHRLRPALSAREWKEVRLASAGLAERIVARAASLQRQLAESHRLNLAPGESVPLTDWTPDSSPTGATLDVFPGPDPPPSFHLAVSSAATVAWHVKVELPAGRYRFEARAMTRGVRPLPFGRTQGAAVRVSGEAPSSTGPANSTPWQTLAVEFSGGGPEQPTQLSLELRASSGEAWFARDSIRLTRRE